MEWIERWNRAMDEIELSLTGEIDCERLGRIACCSAYHFQRMFTYLAGMPLGEYVRRRRMSLAAADLQAGRDKVIDIAARYGYESPTAFNRAFRAVHGIAPSAVRTGGVPVKCYPRMVFSLSVQGGEEMQYRIETRDAFRVVGISRPLDREIENNFREVPLMWDAAARDGTVAALAARMDGEPKGCWASARAPEEKHGDTSLPWPRRPIPARLRRIPCPPPPGPYFPARARAALFRRWRNAS